MSYSAGFRIDIWRCFHILRRQRAVIALVAAGFFLLSLMLTWNGRGDIYSAAATVYSAAGQDYSLREAQEAVTAMRQYRDIVTSGKVLDRAAGALGGNMDRGRLEKMVSIELNKDSSVARIRAESTSPGVCVAVANAVAYSFAEEMSVVTGQDIVRILDEASDCVPVQNGRLVTWLTRLLLTGTAVFAVCVAVLLQDILSRRINSLESAGLSGELDILGTIPELDRVQGSPSVEKP